MSRATLMLWLPAIAQTVFVFALGACMGSLINVLVYRIPKGLSVVTPPSRCPSCDTRLTWRENIPILGWLLLRGKCRFCKAKISPEYPIVEAFVACLFTLFFLLWYLVKPGTTLFGVDLGSVAPDWTANGLLRTWPAFVALLFLAGSLVAMTIIDARTYTIPLALAWVPTLAAVLLHTANAAWFEIAHGPVHLSRPGLWFAADHTRWVSPLNWLWTLPTPSPRDWGWIGAAILGTLGIPVSLLLQKLGLIRHSFADYDEWEARALAEARQNEPEAPARDETGPDSLAGASGSPEAGRGEADDDPAHLWIQYPHARREMFIECAFVAPIVLGFIGGFWLAPRLVTHFAGPYQPAPAGQYGFVPPVEAPLWLTVLAGVCLGYLIGGGVVWMVRILGSLAFGKEAMGIGDVHLMAAVGACVGWIDAVLGFFGAAFVGVAYALASQIVGGKMKRAMPFGPFLAVATFLVLFLRPLLEIALGVVFGSAKPIHLP
ncbi:MAG: prepilin peptidase [Phycisphaeraceae bacterium]|nr:MAG: prepilin peptidase [Phycisphaeraceae bacterium]